MTSHTHPTVPTTAAEPVLERTPVVFVSTDSISGVTSWAMHLRGILKDHPRYRPLLVGLGADQHPELRAHYDILVENVAELTEVLRELGSAIVVPNWLFFVTPVCMGLNARGAQLRVLGICHSDSYQEYYFPLCSASDRYSHFIAVSEECKARLDDLLPARTSDISVLPYGIVYPESVSRIYQPNPIRLIYAGRVVQAQKRVLDLAPLLYLLRERRVPFSLSIVGDGADLPELQRSLQPFLASRSVYFWGRRKPQDMPAIWSAHDVFVQLSDYEGTSVSMLEAMAYGNVPVVTRTSGVKNVVESGENGFVVDIADVGAAADAVSHLAGNRDRLTAMGQRARAGVRRFEMREHAARFVSVLDRVSASPAIREASAVDLALSPYEDLMCRFVKTRLLLLGRQHATLALFPGGRHSAWLVGLMNRWKTLDGHGLPTIAAVVDEASAGRTIGSIPVVAPSELDAHRVDAVVISSDTSAPALTERWKTIGRADLPVYDLYDGLKIQPFPKNV